MKKCFLALYYFSILFLPNLQAQSVEWVKQMGGNKYSWESFTTGNSIQVDSKGNVYTCGYFFDTTDFDPGSGTFYLNPEGESDRFISKLDASGNFIWAKQIKDNSGTFSTEQSMTIDMSGNVYLTGYHYSTTDFDPGKGTFNLTGAGYFILKLDQSGNFVWVKETGGRTIAVDLSGNIYITGSFAIKTDFDPGPGFYYLTPQSKRGEIFITLLNPSGSFVWAKQMKGNMYGGVNSIALDKSGNVLITGSFEGTIDFDPGSGTNNISTSDIDIYVSKFDASGNLIWAKQTEGANGSSDAKSITSDISGNVYITGCFFRSVDFDPGSGKSILKSDSFVNMFISKLDSSGNFVWAKIMKGSRTGIHSSVASIGYAITSDKSGNIYATGSFGGTLDFDPGPGIFSLSSSPSPVSMDIFILKLDISGNFKWVKSFGDTADDWGLDIVLDNTGNIYTTGFFYGKVDFGTASSPLKLNSIEGFDAFVCKISQGTGSLKPLAGENTISVYPNPGHDILNIDLKNQSNAKIKIQVLNSTGQIVMEKNSSIQHLQFNIQHLPQGLYYVKVTDSKGFMTSKNIVKE